MSFLDGGGGGGDPGGGKTSPTGAGPTGDSTGLGMDPTMSGFGDPSMFPGSMGWPGSGSTGGTTTGGTGASNVDATNYGVAQSQAPAPGTTATSIGGVRSDPISDADLQQIVNSLQGSGLRAQATPLAAAAEQAGGPPTTSPGQPAPDEAQAITGPGGAYGGGPTQTSTGLQGTAGPSYPESTFAQQPQNVGPRGGYGGGSPTQTLEPPGPTEVTDEQGGQTFANQPGQVGPRGGYGGGSPTAEQGTASPTGREQRYPPAGARPGETPPAQPPRDPNVPKPEDPKLTPTVPPGTKDQATPPAAPASTGPVSSRGTYDPYQAQTQNPFNPFRALLDLITGNFADLNSMINPMGNQYGQPPQQGGQPPQQGGQPPQQGGQPPQSTPAQIAAMPPAERPGGPDARPDTPDDGLKAQRQEWYKTHDRTDPYPEPQGPVNPKTGIGPGGNVVATQGGPGGETVDSAGRFALNPRGLASTATGRSGVLNSDELYKTLYNNVPNSLIGFVPRDGARFGITTGSREEWAKLQFKLATQESSRSLHAREYGHGGHDAGLFQFAAGDLARRGLGTNVGDPMVQIRAMNMEFEKIRRAGVIGGQSTWPGRGVGGGEYFGPLRDSGINRGVIARHEREAAAVAARNRSPNAAPPPPTARPPRSRGYDLLRNPNRASIDVDQSLGLG